MEPKWLLRHYVGFSSHTHDHPMCCDSFVCSTRRCAHQPTMLHDQLASKSRATKYQMRPHMRSTNNGAINDNGIVSIVSLLSESEFSMSYSIFRKKFSARRFSSALLRTRFRRRRRLLPLLPDDGCLAGLAARGRASALSSSKPIFSKYVSLGSSQKAPRVNGASPSVDITAITWPQEHSCTVTFSASTLCAVRFSVSTLCAVTFSVSTLDMLGKRYGLTPRSLTLNVN